MQIQVTSRGSTFVVHRNISRHKIISFTIFIHMGICSSWKRNKNIGTYVHTKIWGFTLSTCVLQISESTQSRTSHSSEVTYNLGRKKLLIIIKHANSPRRTMWAIHQSIKFTPQQQITYLYCNAVALCMYKHVTFVYYTVIQHLFLQPWWKCTWAHKTSYLSNKPKIDANPADTHC